MTLPDKPAHPVSDQYETVHGFTARERAAIDLCVPDSGTEWLDKMIERARRDRIAERVMAGWWASGKVTIDLGESGPFGTSVNWVYRLADAMQAHDESADLATREGGAA